ncbi:MAG: radical SAM protein [Thermoplasmata archaeon]|nr:MAG: radical SAM protein [Thermoplasmata archaeon]
MVELKVYNSILKGDKKPGYILCKHIPVSFREDDALEKLWLEHDQALKDFKVEKEEVNPSLLDLKREIAYRIYHKCSFCERKCKIDRDVREGVCNVSKARVASEFLHMGEEEVFIPSYTIFFSGCTFNCVFCQNWDISQYKTGIYIQPEILADMIEKRNEQGARNVNWVGGDPTPNIPYIIDVLINCNSLIPQIWNSNMYCSIETMKLLHGIIDVYLTDFKYGNDKCSLRLSKIKNYLEIIKRNHIIAYKQTDILIRHLVMPNHVECCSIPIIRWIADNLPKAAVNIMGQYHPEYKAMEYDDIARYPKHSEIRRVTEEVKELNITIV